ncbi:MAG: hypothetical protein M1511_03180 [Deltaproteobacteria bacterium]|nr:hypothetical protein [Deltaproteobacteria bacterium]
MKARRLICLFTAIIFVLTTVTAFAAQKAKAKECPKMSGKPSNKRITQVESVAKILCVLSPA